MVFNSGSNQLEIMFLCASLGCSQMKKTSCNANTHFLHKKKFAISVSWPLSGGRGGEPYKFPQVDGILPVHGPLREVQARA